jgi:ankyrin repeat protein
LFGNDPKNDKKQKAKQRRNDPNKPPSKKIKKEEKKSDNVADFKQTLSLFQTGTRQVPNSLGRPGLSEKSVSSVKNHDAELDLYTHSALHNSNQLQPNFYTLMNEMLLKMGSMEDKISKLTAVMINQFNNHSIYKEAAHQNPQLHVSDFKSPVADLKTSKHSHLSKWKSSMFLGIRAKDLGKISQIVEQESEWYKLLDENENSPVIAACSQIDSKVFILSYLIDQMQDYKIVADVLMHENKDGLNCYLMAAKMGGLEIMKYIEGLVPNLIKLGLLSNEHYNFDPVIRHMDKNGNNALILATSSSNLNTVKHLLNTKKIPMNSKNGDGYTPIMMAIDSGRYEIVEYLANIRTENLEQKTSEGDTLLTLAIFSKSGLQMIKMLVEKFNVSIYEGGYNDRLPFLVAAECDDLEVLKYLFERHAKSKEGSINYPVTSYVDKLRDNALHLASKFASLKVVKYLLNTVLIDPFGKGYLGMNAYHCAVMENNTEVIKYLRNSYPGIENYTDDKDQSGLMLSIIYGKGSRTLETVLDLERKNGVNVADLLKSARGFNGRNCFQSAIVGNNFEALELLYESSSDHRDLWSMTDKSGSSCLTLAAEFSSFEIFEYVAEKIVEIFGSRVFECLDSNGKNTLDCAMLSLDLEKIKYIVSKNTIMKSPVYSQKAIQYLEPRTKEERHSANTIRELLNLPVYENEKEINNIESMNNDKIRTAAKEVFKAIDLFDFEVAVSKTADAEKIVGVAPRVDYSEIANILKIQTIEAKKEFSVQEYNYNSDQPKSLLSTSSAGFVQKNDNSESVYSSRSGYRRKPGQATGQGVELPAQYHRIVTDGYSLEGDKARWEIAQIAKCDAKKALIQYICYGFKSKLEQTLQRIRRKLIYIVSYRRHQLRTRQVNLDASFNKYTTLHPDRPMYSAKSMLKLIRWCRFFEREYKPIILASEKKHSLCDNMSSIGSAMKIIKSIDCSSASDRLNHKIHEEKTKSVAFTLNRIQLENGDYFKRHLLKSLPETGDSVSDNLNLKEQILHYVPRNDINRTGLENKEFKTKPLQNCDEENIKKRLKEPFSEESFLENFKTENCTICQNKEYVDHDYGVPICQTCLYRRNLFLYGSCLQCQCCDMKLNDDNFHGWMGGSWCKRCIEIKFRKVNPVDSKQLTNV